MMYQFVITAILVIPTERIRAEESIQACHSERKPESTPFGRRAEESIQACHSDRATRAEESLSLNGVIPSESRNPRLLAAERRNPFPF